MSLDAQIMAISRYIDELEAEGTLHPGNGQRLQEMLVRLRNDVADLERTNRTNYAHGQGYY